MIQTRWFNLNIFCQFQRMFTSDESNIMNQIIFYVPITMKT